MANSNNEADQGSYGGNSSLPPASSPGISPADPALGGIRVAGPNTVAKKTLPTEHGIPFSENIMMEELPAHFRSPSHLPAYDGTTDPVEHIHKFENAALLHRYTDGIKCRVFLTTLTNSAQQWFDQLPDGSGLCGGPLFESLAKKPAVDYLDVLTRAEKYMNLEDALLVRRSSRQRENELFSSSRNKEQAEDL
ncbi:UNVERIFIED_CONTAM: hypothetical protein Slati_2792000 [Sesamum latifolium]|uniref:Retrotransposon gag domain-containing protein n=1 Tax=Sesamum latifolium TaxID=2727402 RepID=A0AAW2VYD0_9LAMI